MHTAYSIKPAGDVLFIAKKARAAGADVLITGDDNTAEFEYGLWPLRGLIKYRVSANSVTKAGPDLFLAHLAHVQKQVPDLLIIPGVEAAPFYFWTGNPVTGLKINNWHRHFSVIGMGIDGLLPEKLRLLGCHRSQVNRTHVTNLSIMEMAKSTAIFRGYQYRVKFAEGFVAHRFSLDCHLRPEK